MSTREYASEESIDPWDLYIIQVCDSLVDVWLLCKKQQRSSNEATVIEV